MAIKLLGHECLLSCSIKWNWGHFFGPLSSPWNTSLRHYRHRDWESLRIFVSAKDELSFPSPASDLLPALVFLWIQHPSPHMSLFAPVPSTWKRKLCWFFKENKALPDFTTPSAPRSSLPLPPPSPSFLHGLTWKQSDPTPLPLTSCPCSQNSSGFSPWYCIHAGLPSVTAKFQRATYGFFSVLIDLPDIFQSFLLPHLPLHYFHILTTFLNTLQPLYQVPSASCSHRYLWVSMASLPLLPFSFLLTSFSVGELILSFNMHCTNDPLFQPTNPSLPISIQILPQAWNAHVPLLLRLPSNSLCLRIPFWCP